MKTRVKTRESRAETTAAEKRSGARLATSRAALSREAEAGRLGIHKAEDPQAAMGGPARLRFDFAGIATEFSSVSTPQLLEQAIAGDPMELPQRPALEKGFGFSLAGIPVDRNPAARAALDRLSAEAAVYRGHILLGDSAPSLVTLAHEVAHILQSDSTAAAAAPALSPATEKAEIEAESLAHRVERRAGAPANHIPFAPLATEAALDGGVVALRSSGRAGAPAAAPDAAAAPAADSGRAAERGSPPPERPADNPREPERRTRRAEGEAVEAPAGAAAGAEAVPLGELAPPPEPGVTEEQVAARAEQLAAAQAAFSGAEESPALMDAFVAAPPTLKAQVAGDLGDRFSGAMSHETQKIQENTPAVEAEMNGNTPAAAGTITSPDAAAIELEPTPPAPTPDAQSIVGEAVRNEGSADRNAGITDRISSSLLDPINLERMRAQLEAQSLDNVQTTDPNIVTSPGAPPAVPLQGETDPQRYQNQVDEGSRQGREALTAQKEQALALPGVERVQLADVHESLPLGEIAPPAADAAAAPEGADHYLQLNMPAEVQTAFDDIAGASMQQSQAEAQTQVRQAAQERDEKHQAEVEKARTDTAEAQRTADVAQRDNVADARGKIDESRQKTLQDQDAAVEKMEADAELKRDAERQEFDRQANEKQAEIDGEYAAAEEKADAKVREGEEKAEAERLRKEREAEDQSWWEAALDFITDLFDALVSFINDVFDAVRGFINDVLSAVRDLVIGLIDAIAGALKGLIRAFGEILKGLVQGLLGDVFPELAAALTEAIDGAVEAATSAIDAVADTLKSAVNFIVDTLRAGINALLNVFQGALNAALALARAALTGDWDAFFLQLFEAACRVAGISPETLYAFIGRARETIDLIINDPGQFVSNIFDAVIGGFRLFGENFLTHLQRSVIEWLTGTLGSAGITLPERFDLMGVIGLVAQILGLTWENLRQRIVRVVGERGAQIIEFVAGYVQTLIEGGWSALWERIQNDLASLRDMVLDQLKNYIVERIITAALTRLATMFNPVGALVNLIIAAYQFYTFIRDQMERIARVVSVVAEMIGNIARGVLGPAMQSVESVLAGLLTLALDLLARLLSLGDVGARVREILQGVQASIWRAIDRLIDSVIGMFRGGSGEVSPAVAGAPSAGSDDIGDRITIHGGAETHTLFIIRDARGEAQEMVATTPMPVIDRLNTWDQRKDTPLPSGRPGPGAAATPLIAQARTELSQVAPLADALARQGAIAPRPGAAGAPPAPAAAGTANTQQAVQVTQEERQLGAVLGQLFALFEETPPAGGALAQRFAGNIAAAHVQVQNGLQTAVRALELDLQQDQSAAQLYPDWQAARTAIERTHNFREGARGGPSFRAFIERPLNEGTTPLAGNFPTDATQQIAETGLRDVISSPPPPVPNAIAPPAAAEVPAFVQGQKASLQSGRAPYARSVLAIRAVIWDARALEDARRTVGGELYGRATDPESRPGADATAKIAKYKDMLAAAGVLPSNPEYPPEPARTPPEEGDASTYRDAMRRAIVNHLKNADLAVFNTFINTPNLFAGSYNRIQGDLFSAWIAARYQGERISPNEVVFKLPPDDRQRKADGLRGSNVLLEAKSGDPPIDEDQMREYLLIITSNGRIKGETRILIGGREMPVKTEAITHVIYSFTRGKVARKWYDSLNSILGVAPDTARRATILVGTQPYDHSRTYDD